MTYKIYKNDLFIREVKYKWLAMLIVNLNNGYRYSDDYYCVWTTEFNIKGVMLKCNDFAVAKIMAKVLIEERYRNLIDGIYGNIIETKSRDIKLGEYKR